MMSAACVLSYKINKLFMAAIKHNNIFSFLILVVTCFGLSEH